MSIIKKPKENEEETIRTETPVLKNILAQSEAAKDEKRRYAKLFSIDSIVPFKENPYKVIDNEEMEALAESIKENGVMSPLIIMPTDNYDKKYEVISGHRRLYAAKKAGLKTVPAFVYQISRDEAAVILVDSNLHREHILPSEKAFAYKMKYEALKSQGKRTDLTSGQKVPKYDDNRTAAKLGEETGESYKTVQRYIRLTNLIPELLNLMDEGKIAFSVGVELSYLTENEQRDLIETIESEDCTPSLSQAQRMKCLSQAQMLDMDQIFSVMITPKANQK